jgi:hypothetical protein
MSTPVGKVQRESVSFPVVTEDFCIVHLASAGGAPNYGANLVDAIRAQITALGTAKSRVYPSTFKSIVISASSGNDIILVGEEDKGTGGVGIKIAAGTSMLLGFSGTPADPLLYQCAGVCAVAVYF